LAQSNLGLQRARTRRRAEHGYHHYGPETEVPTSYPFGGLTDGSCGWF
jgi:hypothetical protein